MMHYSPKCPSGEVKDRQRPFIVSSDSCSSYRKIVDSKQKKVKSGVSKKKMEPKEVQEYETWMIKQKLKYVKDCIFSSVKKYNEDILFYQKKTRNNLCSIKKIHFDSADSIWWDHLCFPLICFEIPRRPHQNTNKHIVLCDNVNSGLLRKMSC